jgi:hypothetical protein
MCQILMEMYEVKSITQSLDFASSVSVKERHVVINYAYHKQRGEELRESNSDQNNRANYLRDSVVQETDCVSQCIICKGKE